MISIDPENKILQYCIQGMNAEVSGNQYEAKDLFQQAWDQASTPFEALVAAHYLARVQKDLADVLYWNSEALKIATEMMTPDALKCLPSLYLNVGKSYEDLGENTLAQQNYKLAYHYTIHLEQDGYGNMITLGIQAGIERTLQ